MTKKLEAIAEDLRKRIAKGEFPVGSRLPSEYMLADEYQVNKTTANKAVGLLEHDGLVERRASRAGTIVLAGESFLKGMLLYITSVGHSFHAELLHGAQFAAFRHGYLVGFFSPQGDEEIDSLLRRLPPFVKGLLITAYNIHVSNIPVMYVDRLSLPGQKIHSVNSNSFQGGKLIGKALAEKGHSNVVFFGTVPVSQRAAGVFSSLGIRDFQDRLFIGRFDEFNCISRLKQALKRFPGLTAIACEQDDDAMLIRQCAQRAGLNLKKVLLTGFGNVKSVQVHFPLMTIDQHPFEMGGQAAERLISLIENPPPADHWINDVMDVELLVH